MKLYESELAPSCRRVTIFMAELDIEVEKVAMNIRGGDNLSDDYQSKSINGKVPLLQLGNGACISETVAICRYLDEAFENNKGLFGRGALQKAQVDMWQRIIELDGLFVAFQAFRNLTGVYSDRERCVSAWGEECRLRVAEFIPKLDAQLHQQEFIVAEHLTIADITGFIFIAFAVNTLKMDVLARYPQINAWYERLAARPAFQ